MKYGWFSGNLWMILRNSKKWTHPILSQGFVWVYFPSAGEGMPWTSMGILPTKSHPSSPWHIAESMTEHRGWTSPPSWSSACRPPIFLTCPSEN
jgi:hypothetical protein